MAIHLLLAIVERAHSFYESAEGGRAIEDIWNTLRTVYADIADAHFVSAQAAISAAAHSKVPDAEVRAAIAHLRDAFHIYEALLKQTRSERFLLFWSDEVPLLEGHQQNTVRAALFETATCIAVNYADLNETMNGRTWKDRALAYLDCYCEVATAHLTPEYLRLKISDDLVIAKHVQVIVGATMSHISTRDETHYSLSPAGERYIQNEKARIRASVMKIFEMKGL